MFFYGHPQNRFWKVAASLFDSDPPQTIPEKKAFLKKNHIALWDVIGSCDIAGSSDASIENVVANAAWSVDKLTAAWGEVIGSVFGTEEKICALFERKGLGRADLPVTPVSGGLMHKMYKVNAEGRTYAVKHLNPAVMKRPDAMDNYQRAERLEKIIKDAGIPIVAAMTIDGCKMQRIFGESFYVFPWQEGHITD